MMNESSRKTVLIADDEPLARERIARLVAELPDYDVCGQAVDGEQALKKIAELSPDIVLLDIRMPGMDGMEAAAEIARLETPPAVIFCTAYDDYAIKAFEVRATSYLLKPVRREALAKALQTTEKVNRVQMQSLAQQQAQDDEQIAVKTHRGTELIDLNSVIFCQADHKYVTLHHTRGETVTDFTLKELEQAHPEHLLRIHRNTLVGARFVRALIRLGDGQHAIELAQWDQPLPVSRRHTARVREWLDDHASHSTN